MNRTWLLFSFKGRVQRLYWWIANIAVAVVTGAMGSAIDAVAQSYGMGAMDPDTNKFEPTGLLGILLSVVGLLNLWITYELTAKRLHDRDRSGWWLVAPTLVLIVAIVLGVVTLMQPEGQREPWNSAAVLATFATVAVIAWLFLEIGFLRGTQGANRYGPDPLEGKEGGATL